jgi:hypothetical protein
MVSSNILSPRIKGFRFYIFLCLSVTESEEDDEDERGEEDAEAMEFEEVRNGVVDGLQYARNGELEEKDGSLVDASEEEVHEEEVELQMSEEDADNPDMLASRGSTGASTE